MDELKACPFCGSEYNEGHKETCYFRVRGKSDADREKAWQSRPGEAAAEQRGYVKALETIRFKQLEFCNQPTMTIGERIFATKLIKLIDEAKEDCDRFCAEKEGKCDEVEEARRLMQIAEQRTQQLNKMIAAARLAGSIEALDKAIQESYHWESAFAVGLALEKLKSEYLKGQGNDGQSATL